MDPVHSGAIPKRPLHQPEALQQSPSEQSSDEEGVALSHRKVVPMLSTLAREQFVKLTDQERLERLDKLADKEKVEFYLSFSPDDEFFKNKKHLDALLNFAISHYFSQEEINRQLLTKEACFNIREQLVKKYNEVKNNDKFSKFRKKCLDVDFWMGFLFLQLRQGLDYKNTLIILMRCDPEILIQRAHLLMLLKSPAILKPTNNDYETFSRFIDLAKKTFHPVALFQALKVALFCPDFCGVSAFELVGFCNYELLHLGFGRELVSAMAIYEEDVTSTGDELSKKTSLREQILYFFSTLFGNKGKCYEVNDSVALLDGFEEGVFIESLDLCCRISAVYRAYDKNWPEIDKNQSLKSLIGGVSQYNIVLSVFERVISKKIIVSQRSKVSNKEIKRLKTFKTFFNNQSIQTEKKLGELIDKIAPLSSQFRSRFSDVDEALFEFLIGVSLNLVHYSFCFLGLNRDKALSKFRAGFDFSGRFNCLIDFAKKNNFPALLNDVGNVFYLFGDLFKAIEAYQLLLKFDLPKEIRLHIEDRLVICQSLKIESIESEIGSYNKFRKSKFIGKGRSGDFVKATSSDSGPYKSVSLKDSGGVGAEAVGPKAEESYVNFEEKVDIQRITAQKNEGTEKKFDEHEMRGKLYYEEIKSVPINLREDPEGTTSSLESDAKTSHRGVPVSKEAAPPCVTIEKPASQGLGYQNIKKTEGQPPKGGFFEGLDNYLKKLNILRTDMDLGGELDWINQWVENAKNLSVRARVKLDASGFYLRQLSACGREFLLKGHEDPIVQARMTRRYAVSALNDLLGLNMKGCVTPDQLKDILLGCHRDNPALRHNRWLCSCLKSVCSLMAHSYSEQRAVSYRNKKMGGHSLYRQYYQLKTVADPLYRPPERSLPESKVRVVTPEVFKQLKLQDS